MRLLVVEDERLMAQALEQILIDQGHEVIGPAATLDEGIAHARSAPAPPDLALVDIALADGSKGTDLARQLLKDLGVPSVFVTGNAKEAMDAKDAALGYICKPCRCSTVVSSLEVVQAILDGEQPDSAEIPHGFNLFRGAGPHRNP